MVKIGGWLKQRSGLEKSLLLICVFLIVALFTLIAISAHLQGNGNPHSNEDTCTTKDCIETAGQMLSLLSEGCDPCSDFYECACGGGDPRPHNALYSAIRDVLESSDDVSQLDTVRSLYRSCMEFEGLQDKGKKPDEALKSLMAKAGVGTWPVIDAYFDVDSTLTQDERLVALVLVGVPTAYRVDVIPTINGSSFILKLSPGSPRVSRSSDVRGDAKLKTHMLTSFLLLGAPYSRAAADVLDILSVDNAYADIEQNTNTECGSTYTLSPEEALAELTKLISNNDWSVLLTAVQKFAGLTRPFAVQVYCKEKIQKYIDYLNDLSVRSAYNYLGWRFFATFSSHILPSRENRWQECAHLIERFAAPTLSHLLTPNENGTIEKVIRLASDVKRNVEEALTSTKWLNEDQKLTLKKQLKPLEIHLPFSQASPEPILLKNLKVGNGNYTAAVLELCRRSVAQMWKRLAHPHLDTRKKLHLTEAFLSEEELSIPLEKIQEPYFNRNVPEWRNSGGLGIYTARQLSKTLLGRSLGTSQGEKTTLWDVWYSNRAASECLLNYISSRFTENNEMRIKELFLDSSSLEIAYQSLTMDSKIKELPGLSKTKEQLFFIAFAQAQCAPLSDGDFSSIRGRVNAAVFNSRAFIKAFKCDSSSTCDIWR